MCQAQALANVLQLKIMILLGKTSNYRRLELYFNTVISSQPLVSSFLLNQPHTVGAHP